MRKGKNGSVKLKSSYSMCLASMGLRINKFANKLLLMLIRDIEQGLISTVIVYKLDRISRSIIDFARMMELFQRYNVEFVSATEKFDTSTPMGRTMLNICIDFAQLERETIQKRVQDAFHSRCRKGFL